MDNQEIETRVRKVAGDHLCHDLSEFPAGDNLFALPSADSLDQVEIVMAIEDEFGIEISDDLAYDCETIADFCGVVARLCA